VSWQEFLRGKKKRKDVAEFSLHFMDNILALHRELSLQTYQHGSYHAFKINDPKPRDIHKASVRDRLLHHALCRVLYPYFEKQFIHDSYSCRENKGTHRAVDRFRDFARKVSRNNTRTVWVLKCDIRKFFANIDHAILMNILRKNIKDSDALVLLEQIIGSFHSQDRLGVGLPLGNLTSQLLVNVYMNEFDQFAKRKLKAEYYVRYADDFIFLNEDRGYLEELLPQISGFLGEELKLSLHPDKVSIKTFASGVDFLGWVNFTHHRVLRTKTKQRMFQRLKQSRKAETRASYLGLLSHGNTHGVAQEISIRYRV
jgi:retron-type reverse transcriptase